MAQLKVRLRGKEVAEIPLSEERQYVAGRKEECDIRLEPEKGISREHFRLSFANGAWNLELLSRFGEVLLGGEKVSNAVLDHGAIFVLPPYEFEFLTGPGESQAIAPFEPGSSREGGGELVPSGSREPFEAAIEKTFVGIAPSVPYIKFINAQGETTELIRLDAGDSWIGGRESSCHIHIRDQRVSRRQFEIRKAGSAFSILDLGSVNGTLLNGNPISSSDPTPLKSGDAISVLENYLYFELHDPHFKSRLEMINLPPVSDAFMPVPQTERPGDFHPAVMNPGGYPLPTEWQAPPPEPPPASASSGPLTRFVAGLDKKQKIRLVLVSAILFLGVMMILPSNDGGDSLPGESGVAEDPLSKLSAEQKKLVRDTLQLSKSYYMQGKYEFAKSELIKMMEVVPEYEDSRELMKLVDEAIYVQQQQRKQDELEKSQRENEERIQRKVAECKKQITPDFTRDQMEACLSDVMVFNPAHPLFDELFAQIEALQAEKQAKLAAKANYASEVARLQNLFEQARNLENSNKPLSAIKAYERVINSDNPDPKGLKSLARQKISRIRGMMNSKTSSLQKEAENYEKQGQLKDAILSLRKAKKMDPQNDSLDEKISSLVLRLQEEMLRIYQEGILEESFGNVEGDETRPGAKQKWRDILKRDIPDGEYYKKAFIKLKKYGSPQ